MVSRHPVPVRNHPRPLSGLLPAQGLGSDQRDDRPDRLNDTDTRTAPTPTTSGRSLLEAADARDDMLAMFLRLAWVTGCRKSELLKLRWVDIDPIEHDGLGAAISITDTKNHEDRTVYIDKATYALLKAHEQRYRKPSSLLVFPSRTKNGLYNVNVPFREARAAAELDQPDERYGEVLTIHHIRHTWATRLGEKRRDAGPAHGCRRLAHRSNGDALHEAKEFRRPRRRCCSLGYRAMNRDELAILFAQMRRVLDAGKSLDGHVAHLLEHSDEILDRYDAPSPISELMEKRMRQMARRHGVKPDTFRKGYLIAGEMCQLIYDDRLSLLARRGAE
jgi:hypothetical protein